MKIHYDAEVDALYLEFQVVEAGAAEARSLTDDIIADYAPDGTLAGLEILDASQILGAADGKVVVEITPSLASPPLK